VPPSASRRPLLERRLIYVLGKGGVGRTTTAAALGLIASRRGARTIVAEVSGRGELAALFGREPRAGEVEIAPRLWAIQIDTARALDEYLAEHLPLRMLADLVGATRLIGYLAAATPGLRELLNAGKVWELAQPERRVPDASPYDLVIVDAPASGHALALLTAPQSFARAAQGGPIARQGGRIDETLHDPDQTALVGVARGNDASVTELVELTRRIDTELGLALELIVADALPRAPLEPADAQALERVRPGLAGLTRAAVERALAQSRDAGVAREQVERLGRELPGVPLVELARSDSTEFGLDELEALAAELEVAL
jgi:anion-transporting  ArsA/GET3 family ATPase